MFKKSKVHVAGEEEPQERCAAHTPYREEKMYSIHLRRGVLGKTAKALKRKREKEEEENWGRKLNKE